MGYFMADGKECFCNSASDVMLLCYSGFIMTGRCYVMDVIKHTCVGGYHSGKVQNGGA
jgi:hypothetical protein